MSGPDLWVLLGDTAEISEAWYQVVGTYQGSNPEVAAFMLETLQRYVSLLPCGLWCFWFLCISSL